MIGGEVVDMSVEEVCLLREQVKDIKKNINQLFFLLNENFLEKPAKYAVRRIGFSTKNRYLGCQGTHWMRGHMWGAQKSSSRPPAWGRSRHTE